DGVNATTCMEVKTMKNLFKTVAVMALLLGAGLVSSQSIEAPTGELGTQLQTAIQHAGFAASAEDQAMASRHLGHVLNCLVGEGDRKSTRLNSSHVKISYAVFCLKKKNCIYQ